MKKRAATATIAVAAAAVAKQPTKKDKKCSTESVLQSKYVACTKRIETSEF